MACQGEFILFMLSVKLPSCLPGSYVKGILRFPGQLQGNERHDPDKDVWCHLNTKSFLLSWDWWFCTCWSPGHPSVGFCVGSTLLGVFQQCPSAPQCWVGLENFVMESYSWSQIVLGVWRGAMLRALEVQEVIAEPLGTCWPLSNPTSTCQMAIPRKPDISFLSHSLLISFIHSLLFALICSSIKYVIA